MSLFRSPLRQEHAWLRRFARDRRALGPPRSLLRGYRGLKFPLLALMTQRELGSCRHALSQRVVAGTMAVHFPLQKKKPARTEPET